MAYYYDQNGTGPRPSDRQETLAMAKTSPPKQRASRARSRPIKARPIKAQAKSRGASASKAKTASPTGPSKQLRISSAYGVNKASGKPDRQVQGHNGAGRSQPTTVTPGANSGQTVDYVPPDANIVQPSEAGIVSRYFVPSSASKRP